MKLLLQPLAYTIGSPKTGGYGGANPIQAILEEVKLPYNLSV